MSDAVPALFPSDPIGAPLTPTITRRPMPTQQELEIVRARPLTDSAVLNLPPKEREALILDRTKRSEAAALEAADAAVELRGHVATLATQQSLMATQLADHAAKIEHILRRLAIGGSIGGVALVVLKILDLVLR